MKFCKIDNFLRKCRSPKLYPKEVENLKKQMLWKKLEKSAKGLDPDGFMGKFFQTFKKSTILLL